MEYIDWLEKKVNQDRLFIKKNNYRKNNYSKKNTKKYCIKCKNIKKYYIGIHYYFTCGYRADVSPMGICDKFII